MTTPAPALTIPVPPESSNLLGFLILDSEQVPLIVGSVLGVLTRCDACAEAADYVICDVHGKALSPMCQVCLDNSRLDPTSPDTWFAPFRPVQFRIRFAR